MFLGAAVILRRSEHFVIDLIPRRVDERIGRLLRLVVLVFVIAISLVLLVGGVLMTQGGLTRISTASGLHRAWAFAALPAGGLFMVIFSVELAVRVWRRERLPEQEGGLVEAAPGAPAPPSSPPSPEDAEDAR